jgi:hypothetical protein
MTDKPHLWLVDPAITEEDPCDESSEESEEDYEQANELARGIFMHLTGALGHAKYVSLSLLGRAVATRVLLGEQLAPRLLAFACALRWLEARHGESPVSDEDYAFASDTCRAAMVVFLAEHDVTSRS